MTTQVYNFINQGGRQIDVTISIFPLFASFPLSPVSTGVESNLITRQPLHFFKALFKKCIYESLPPFPAFPNHPHAISTQPLCNHRLRICSFLLLPVTSAVSALRRRGGRQAVHLLQSSVPHSSKPKEKQTDIFAKWSPFTPSYPTPNPPPYKSPRASDKPSDFKSKFLTANNGLEPTSQELMTRAEFRSSLPLVFGDRGCT